MVLDDKKGKLLKAKQVLTPVARASYAKLLKPAPNLQGEEKYSVSMIFPEDADLSVLKEAVKQAIRDKWGSNVPKLLRSPFRDGAEREDEAYENSIFVNSNSKTAPQVGEIINKKFTALTDPEQVYSGMYIRASLTAFAYDASGNRGVSFGLGNVLKIRDGKRLDGRTTGDQDFDGLDDSESAQLDDSLIQEDDMFN